MSLALMTKMDRLQAAVRELAPRLQLQTFQPGHNALGGSLQRRRPTRSLTITFNAKRTYFVAEGGGRELNGIVLKEEGVKALVRWVSGTDRKIDGEHLMLPKGVEL